MPAPWTTDAAWIWISLAGFVLLIGTVVLLAWRLRAPADTLAVALMKLLVRSYLRTVHGLRAVPDPLPAEGATILVANHRSGTDPLVLAIHTRRQIRFLMAREYYRFRPLHWLYRSLRTIPVNRDGKDLAATKEALRALHAGDVIGIFPEGEIRETGLGFAHDSTKADDAIPTDTIKEGAALLALKTGVPVVTAFIDGTPAYDSVFRAFVTPSRSRIVFGKPMVFANAPCRRPPKTLVKAATRRIVESLLELQNQLCGDPEDKPVDGSGYAALPDGRASGNVEVPVTKTNPQ